MIALLNKDNKSATNSARKMKGILKEDASLNLILQSEILKIEKKFDELNNVYDLMIKNNKTKIMSDIASRVKAIIVDKQGETPSTAPTVFRWRKRTFHTASATGPERLSPEWWLDDPNWRSGTRDYWKIETETGEQLWIFETKTREYSGGWFCHGDFC